MVALQSSKDIILSGPLHGSVIPSQCHWSLETATSSRTICTEGMRRDDPKDTLRGASVQADGAERRQTNTLAVHLTKGVFQRDIWASVFSRVYLSKQFPDPF